MQLDKQQATCIQHSCCRWRCGHFFWSSQLACTHSISYHSWQSQHTSWTSNKICWTLFHYLKILQGDLPRSIDSSIIIKLLPSNSKSLGCCFGMMVVGKIHVLCPSKCPSRLHDHFNDNDTCRDHGAVQAQNYMVGPQVMHWAPAVHCMLQQHDTASIVHAPQKTTLLVIWLQAELTCMKGSTSSSDWIDWEDKAA